MLLVISPTQIQLQSHRKQIFVKKRVEICTALSRRKLYDNSRPNQIEKYATGLVQFQFIWLISARSHSINEWFVIHIEMYFLFSSHSLCLCLSQESTYAPINDSKQRGSKEMKRMGECVQQQRKIPIFYLATCNVVVCNYIARARAHHDSRVRIAGLISQ